MALKVCPFRRKLCLFIQRLATITVVLAMCLLLRLRSEYPSPTEKETQLELKMNFASVEKTTKLDSKLKSIQREQKPKYKQDIEMNFYYKKYINKTWEMKHLDIPLLTLFTTWNSSMQKPVVYRNAVNNWSYLSTQVKTIVFTNDDDVQNVVKDVKCDVLPVTRLACFETPVLRTMFEDAMSLSNKSKLYAYSNADIIYNNGLVKTLEKIVKSPYFKKGPILIVGKRIDVNVSHLNEPEVNTTEDVDKLASFGKIHYGMAADFYITNNLFPWEFVPDLAIGRIMVDNWLIWYARQIGAKVIDITGTVLAVHQLADGVQRNRIRCNKEELIKSNLLPIHLPILGGMIECASYETKYNGRGEVLILRKTFLQKVCLHNVTIFR